MVVDRVVDLFHHPAEGNVYEAVRLAGIMAAEKTWDLIPLCHPIQLTAVKIDFLTDLEGGQIRASSRVRTHDRTGVEMEALVAVTHAALTIYDMCKAVDRDMEIRSIRLTYKTGGRSGAYKRGCLDSCRFGMWKIGPTFQMKALMSLGAGV